MAYSHSPKDRYNKRPRFDSNSTEQDFKRSSYEPLPPNHVILLKISNVTYPITVDVIHSICSPHGHVLRIVVFQRNGVKCMIEFDSVKSAKASIEAIDGADIYSGCCTIRAEYAKPTRLNIHHNDTQTFDYTLSEDISDQASSNRKALLPEPHNQSMGRMQNGPADYARTPRMLDGAFKGRMMQYGGQMEFMPRPQHEELMFRHNSEASEYYVGPSPRFGSYPQNCVLMVYGLNPDKMNCFSLFNLFCLYGNVLRIKFLRTKEGTAMVQMDDPAAVDRVMINLNNVELFDSQLQISLSKQPYLKETRDPNKLPDGTSCFEDYSHSRNNRFGNSRSASKNRCVPPARLLHFYNTPLNTLEEAVVDFIVQSGAPSPVKVRVFPSRSSRSCSGLVEFSTVYQAVEALVICNHLPMEVDGHSNTVKLCFSSMHNIDSIRTDNSTEEQ